MGKEQEVLVRPYVAADEEQVIALWHACNLVVPWNDPKQDIDRKLHIQPDLFLTGIVEERVVATVMAGYDGHRGWLYSLAVLPDLQRQGLGRAIVEAAEVRLKALGCCKINLQVRDTNAAAIGFYESLGFAVENRISLGKRL